MQQPESNDKFPGYQHYPASEDITKSDNNNGVLRPDGNENTQPPYNIVRDARGEEVTLRGSEADVTADDIKMLEAAAQNMNTIDSVNLQHAGLDNTDDDGDPINETGSYMEDMTGEGLDVPGSEGDDGNENIGEEDEENNYYSLGGDNHESQEESKE